MNKSYPCELCDGYDADRREDNIYVCENCEKIFPTPTEDTMTKKQWLRQIMQFDEKGRSPSISRDVPLQYGTRMKCFELRGYTWGKMDKLYKEFLENKREKKNENNI
tara:strand:- start:5527 stop:5847 length:321 start_codon:yes stop_codon:yes gene_type:complete